MKIRGIVEGFYGPPWSWHARLEVMAWCHERGMTHYLYAPKDDPKHRSAWREPYDGAELRWFRRLAEAGTLKVGFAISPGLSIRYDAAADREALLAKIRQVTDQGIRLVVLALDDIPLGPGSGHRHGELAAWLLERLLPDDVALAMVPTDYTSCEPNPYLTELARETPEEIPIAWTGRWVVPGTVRVSDAEARAHALGGRAPLLWDNYPVNDGPMRGRLHMGPLRGREPGLRRVLAGYLANPMIQPRCSLLPLATQAAWLQGEDPGAAWEREAGSWRVLAEACDGLRAQALVEAVIEATEHGGWYEPLRAWVRYLEEAAGCTAPGLEDEAGAWVAQAREEARFGLELARTYQSLHPVVKVDARGAGAVAGPDPKGLDAVPQILFRWPRLSRTPVSVFGERFALVPRMRHAPDGGWLYDGGLIEEGASAIDRWARHVLDLLSRRTPAPTLRLEASRSGLVEVGSDGTFRAEPGETLVARCGGLVCRASPPAAPPFGDARLGLRNDA